LASGKVFNPQSSTASRFDLAVLGADDPLGGAVLQLLEEHEIPVGRLYPLTLRDPEANVVFRGQDWPCEPAAEFDYSQAQALLVASKSPATLRVLREIRSRRPTMPVLTLEDIDPAPAVAVSRVLKTLAVLGGGLVSADAFVALPAAIAGQDGVEELANQSRGLFNMESAEPEVFPLQIAFNLVPHGSVSDVPSYEGRLAEVTARGVMGGAVAYSVVWAPLFFGSAISLHARTENILDIQSLRGALAHRDGIILMEADLPAATPTPATDAQGSEAVFVSRIRLDGKLARLWLVFDPIQMEAAQMVAAVENWIDKPASSMLT
jgi:aspartate-semialdehyde dehydrogenase